MKLFGNHKEAKHVTGKRFELTEEYDFYEDEKTTDKSGSEEKPKRKGIRIFIIVLLVLLALGACGYGFLNGYIRPPAASGKIRPVTPDDTGIHGEDQNTDGSAPAGRYDHKYTFLLLGCDDGNGNTDTIMVGTFDAKEYTLDIVSIPRDTLVNVSWTTKKANTLYGRDNVERAKSGFSDLLGYDLDFYMIVDLKAFVQLVDAVGGIRYNVPDVEGGGKGMNYEDPAQNLYIHLKPGEQVLTGQQAVGVVRYRKGYRNADIGRIGTQQDFLMTAAKQIIDNKSSISLKDIVTIFLNYVKTDLDYGECAWFAKELLKMDVENINFHTLPGKYDDSLHQGNRYVSYVTIYVDEWLEMINTYLNPFDQDIKESNLNILTRDSNGNLYATSGKIA